MLKGQIVITPQPIIQPTQQPSATVEPQSPKPAAPVKAPFTAPVAAAAKPAAIPVPAITASVFINPKTLRTVAKLTDSETGEVIGFIPPKIVSATYSAAASNAQPGLVTSGLS